MPIYKPSELVKYLSELGVSPKKRLSQNFLLDGNVIKKIVAFAKPSPKALIIEIGPGPGAITEELLKTGARILAIEKDKALAKGLERLKSSENRLSVYCEDILQFPLEEEVKQANQKAIVIANLPFHLSTHIMTLLIPRHDLLREMTVIVQEEVARRFLAAPCSKDYGSVTVFIHFYSTPQYGFKVSHNCFFPKPKVNSAVVKFTLHPPPNEIAEDSFFRMTRAAFAKRRKMLNTTLGPLYPHKSIRSILKNMEKSPQCRPEELSLKEFLQLHQQLTEEIGT